MRETQQMPACGRQGCFSAANFSVVLKPIRYLKHGGLVLQIGIISIYFFLITGDCLPSGALAWKGLSKKIAIISNFWYK
jgi:hypothetical protein